MEFLLDRKAIRLVSSTCCVSKKEGLSKLLDGKVVKACIQYAVPIDEKSLLEGKGFILICSKMCMSKNERLSKLLDGRAFQSIVQ